MSISSKYKSSSKNGFQAISTSIKVGKHYEVHRIDEVGTRRSKIGHSQIPRKHEASL